MPQGKLKPSESRDKLQFKPMPKPAISKRKPKTAAVKLKARHVRPNSQYNEEAVIRSYNMMAARCRKSEIKTVLKMRYTMSNRTIERVLHEARARVIAASGKTEQEHKDDAYVFYDSVVRRHEGGLRFRLLAQERIDKLLALEGPIKLELSGGVAHEAKLAHQLLSDPAAAELLEKLDERFAAARAGDKK